MTRFVSTFALLLIAAPAFAAGVIPEPYSYTKPIADGKFLFVMLGDADAEAKAKDADARAAFRELRAKYPRTGLYSSRWDRRPAGPDSQTGETPVPPDKLVWALDDPAYAPADNIFVSTDGVYLVRIDGESWRTMNYPGGKRLPADVERRQLDAPAVSFFADGKRIQQYALKDLVTNPMELPHSPEHVLWPAGAVLNEDTGRFILFLQDQTRLTFDYRNGDLLSRTRSGLGNPMLTGILIACAVLVASVLGVWAYLVFLRPGKPATNPVRSR
jgi:hypothetical protein